MFIVHCSSSILINNAPMYFCRWFQKACGSLSNLLKIRSGSDTDTDSASSENVDTAEKDSGSIKKDGNNDDSSVQQNVSDAKTASSDLSYKMTSHIDKLDALLTKAENAQYSMAHQNKQMKSCMK